MVLSFKFNLNQTRKFHTFHFKFKRLLNPCDPAKSSSCRRLIKSKQQPNFLSRTTSINNLFNIGNQFCRMSSINPIVIEPSSTHKSTLFFFHGLGDTGHGWSDYWQCLGVNQNLKIVLPTAPSIKITLNMGMKMPSWFDIYGLSDDSKEDEEGIKKASEYVHGLIEDEISKTGLSSDKILLGGFSMGAALAIYSAFTYPKKLAGVIVYSGWLPLHKNFNDRTIPANREINILQCHGDADMVVPLKWGQMSKDYITNQLKNENVVFKIYANMAHGGCTEETRDTKEYLNNLLPKL